MILRNISSQLQCTNYHDNIIFTTAEVLRLGLLLLAIGVSITLKAISQAFDNSNSVGVNYSFPIGIDAS